MGATGLGFGGSNTIIGRNTFVPTDATSNGNTFLGTNAGLSSPSTNVTSNTIIGAFSFNSTTAYNNSSCLGYQCVIGGNQSTAIGYNASTSVEHSIVLGTSSETVYCVGVPTTGTTPYTSLVLSSGIQLQTTYSSEPTVNQLGYKLSTTTLLATVTGATGGVPLNVLSITIPTIGIYLCEASIYYSTSVADFYVFCSISTTSATANSSNKNNVFTSAAVQTNQIVRTTGVITTTSANTVLYAVGQAGFASQTIASGFLQFTRIA